MLQRYNFPNNNHKTFFLLPSPSNAVSRFISNMNGGSSRRGRSKLPATLDPMVTHQALMSAYSVVNQNDLDNVHHRYGKLLISKVLIHLI